jgi:hypothetical protein
MSQEVHPYCHADSDGDCEWEGCPQKRDGEPKKSGRHCPYDQEAVAPELLREGVRDWQAYKGVPSVAPEAEAPKPDLARKAAEEIAHYFEATHYHPKGKRDDCRRCQRENIVYEIITRQMAVAESRPSAEEVAQFVNSRPYYASEQFSEDGENWVRKDVVVKWIAEWMQGRIAR